MDLTKLELTPTQTVEPASESALVPSAGRVADPSRFWSYALIVVTAAAAAVVTANVADERMLELSVPLMGVVITAMFIVAERFPIHYEYRHEAHSFSLSSIPLVIGLFAVAPTTLVAARLVAGAVVLVLSRRQAPYKLLTNLSSFWLEVAVACALFVVLVPEDPLSIHGWLAAIAASLVADVVQAVVISGAIGIHTRSLVLRDVLPTFLGTVAALVDSCVAVVAVTLLQIRPAAVVLLAVVPVILWISYGAYSRLREQHLHLEQLYEFSRSMGDAVVRGEVIERLLYQTSELLHADTAWIYVPPGPDSEDASGTSSTLDAAGRLRTTREIARGAAAALHDTLSGTRPRLVRHDDGDMGHLLARLGHTQALVAPLSGPGGAVATLVVADRSGAVRGFRDDDLRLFDTLAQHAMIALDNNELINRLRIEAATNHYQSLHDSLTGLPNRSYFDRTLGEALRAHETVAVLLLDLDRFKEVNDTLGHYTGDLLLQQVGCRLQSVLRHGDTVARLGGDEFAVLLPGVATIRAAQSVAASLNEALEEPFVLGEVRVEVGGSIGIAMAPEHGHEAEALLQRADVAMYQAKSDGSGHTVYAAERDDYSLERLALVGELRAAIGANEVELHYQPQIDLATGTLTGVEALARWTHPERGPIPPAEFVRIAENTGLIGLLTDYVLRNAIEQCARWRSEGHDLRMSVNLSARDLVDDQIVAVVHEYLVKNGVPPSALCLEITETSVVADLPTASKVLTSLSQLGIVVSIDDFGTGYSSLAYLDKLPVQELKLDRSFVNQLDGGLLGPSHTSITIVASITDLATELGMTVVAEGVESASVHGKLVELGCTSAQGYYFSRPLPVDVLESWMRTSAWGAIPWVEQFELHSA